MLATQQQPTLNASAEHKCDDGTESGPLTEYTRHYTTTATNILSNDRLLTLLLLIRGVEYL